MHALQDYLLDQYDRQGLLIEANPTSNVYIARLQGYHEHPIFRWSPPDESVLQAGGVGEPYAAAPRSRPPTGPQPGHAVPAAARGSGVGLTHTASLHHRLNRR